MNIRISIDDRPNMPEYLTPAVFNRREINAGLKDNGSFQNKKDLNRKKRKQAKK